MTDVSWVQRAQERLAAAGRKRGGARRAVLELLGGVRCALTPPQIDELESLRLVQRVETGQAMVRFERVCESEEHHHHLVCDECGVVMPFSDAALERAITSLSRRVPLAVSEHEIVIHGACRDCSS
jgi:Fur family ferric uptake transcriptional regulator